MALPFTTAGEVNRIVDNKLASIPQPQAEVLFYDNSTYTPNASNESNEVTSYNVIIDLPEGFSVQEGDKLFIQVEFGEVGIYASSTMKLTHNVFDNENTQFTSTIVDDADGSIFSAIGLSLENNKIYFYFYASDDSQGLREYCTISEILIEKLPY